jgi:hypothetical protein
MTTPQWSVVKDGDAASKHTGATRNPNAERGVGRAWRDEPNMTPVLKSNMRAVSNRIWKQGKAVEVKKDLTGRPGAMTVVVRAANAQPAAIGIQGSHWGIAGFGDDPPAQPVSKVGAGVLIGIGVIAAAILLSGKR